MENYGIAMALNEANQTTCEEGKKLGHSVIHCRPVDG